MNDLSVLIDHFVYFAGVKELLTSTSAAKLAGVGVSSIKRWADEGKIRAVKTPGGHRRFVKTDLVDYLKNGSKVSSPASENPGESWLKALLTMNTFELQGALLSSRGRLGSWYRVMDELGAGVKSLGDAWAEGEISLGEEHIATEKLSSVLSNLYDMVPETSQDPVCLLACVEGDLHTLGLSMLRVVLREAGWRSIWMGSFTPVSELSTIIAKKEVSMVALSASRSSRNTEILEAQAEEVAAMCRDLGITLVLGGMGQWPMEVHSARRFHNFTSFHSFVDAP
ncbi:MAG: helix-turn-helix domain-containing protein [Rhodothermales bacterium]|nr:helix-turn-helix domain-containing protein [Rhodothermales bacterium]MDG2015737.1 helix-turn-helix domain-containing protein [Rhodothermales bacterium]